MRECYYVPHELLPRISGQIPDAIGLDFDRPLDEQLMHFASRVKNSEPRTILPNDMPEVQAQAWVERVLVAHRRLQLTLANRESAWPQWLKNSLYNVDAVRSRGVPIDQADWSLCHRKAIIVGNGPSLDTTGPQLVTRRDEFAIISTWHGLARLVKIGITPDAIIHIDKLAPRTAHSEPLPNHIPLIGSPTAHHSYYRSYPDNPIFYMLGSENEAHYHWAALLEKPMHPPAYGTVAAAGVRAASTLGHKAITLTGVDLSFRSAEEALAYNHDPESIARIEGQEGKVYFSNSSFLIYRDMLTALATELGETYTLENASPGGLPIQGFLDACL